MKPAGQMEEKQRIVFQPVCTWLGCGALLLTFELTNIYSDDILCKQTFRIIMGRHANLNACLYAGCNT